MTRVVPQRPLLAPWYRLAEDGDRMLLEHGQSVVVLEGAAVRALLPALLPRLDGTRSLEDLVAELGVAVRPAVELALETLAANGLLVEGPDEPLSGAASAQALAAAFELAPSVAAGRLRAAVVGVVGSSLVGGQVARLLRCAGIGEVLRLDWPGSAAVDFVVAAPAPEEPPELDSWNRRAVDEHIRWLPVRPYDGLFAAVGPLIVPGESCCYECVLLRRAANLDYGDDLPRLEQVPIAARPDPALSALVAAFAAGLVLRFVVGHDPTLPGVLYAIAAGGTQPVTRHPVLRVPRCPVCSPVEEMGAPLPWHAAIAA